MCFTFGAAQEINGGDLKRSSSEKYWKSTSKDFLNITIVLVFFNEPRFTMLCYNCEIFTGNPLENLSCWILYPKDTDPNGAWLRPGSGSALNSNACEDSKHEYEGITVPDYVENVLCFYTAQFLIDSMLEAQALGKIQTTLNLFTLQWVCGCNFFRKNS